MSSLLTNTSAMVALQTLRSINTQLDQTNNRVSTGLRVNTAADNAAYWSIATTIKSDNSALGAVTDSLSLGASTLTTTYNGLDAAVTALNDIKDQLTTATGANVDKAKVQQTIAADQAQLYAVAKASSFSGQNWLYTGSSTATSTSIVSSVSRDSSNALTIGTIDVNLANIRLYGDVKTATSGVNGGTQSGILDSTLDLTQYTSDSNTAATVQTSAVNFAHANDLVSFTVSQGGGAAVTVNINAATLASAGLSDTSIRSDADLASVLNQALSDAGVSGITASVGSNHHVVFSSLSDFDIGAAADGGGTDTITVTDLGLKATAPTTSSASAGATSVADIDITSADSSTIQGYLQIVDKALSSVTSAASQIGTYQNRVTSQQNFVKALSDANTTAVGALVDANMEEESTKLKALQTQQQLAVQSLSIANASTQNILTLFR